MKVLSIIVGVLLAVGGFLLMMTPGMTFSSISWVIGILLVFAGVSAVVDFFASRKNGTHSVTEIVIGVLCGILGILVLVNPFISLLADGLLIYAFDFWLIIGGVMRLVRSIQMKKEGDKSWVWVLVFAILSVLVGVYALFNIILSAMAIGLLAGAVVLMNGISMIVASSAMGSSGESGGNHTAAA